MIYLHHAKLVIESIKPNLKVVRISKIVMNMIVSTIRLLACQSNRQKQPILHLHPLGTQRAADHNILADQRWANIEFNGTVFGISRLAITIIKRVCY